MEVDDQPIGQEGQIGASCLLEEQVGVEVADIPQEARPSPVQAEVRPPQGNLQGKVIKQWFCRTCRIYIAGNRCPICLHTTKKKAADEKMTQDCDEPTTRVCQESEETKAQGRP